jgi:hypothetical protein
MATGLILPFLTGQIPEIGNMLLPMHLPILLCGLICGPWYGLAVGVTTPLLRSLIFHMPPLYPKAIAMAFELGTYALIIGIIFHFVLKKQNILSLYISLVSSMLAGRAVWGVVTAVLMGVGGKSFTFALFITEALVNAIPGIVLQLILIPAIMVILHRTRLIKFNK